MTRVQHFSICLSEISYRILQPFIDIKKMKPSDDAGDPPASAYVFRLFYDIADTAV